MSSIGSALPSADDVEAKVREWLAVAREVKPDANAMRLAGVLKDPHGLDFTLGFVDRVVRPEDSAVAGRNFERLAERIPAFLAPQLRFAIAAGGGFGRVLSWAIVPVARRVLRQMVSHLVIDATPKALGSALERLRQPGVRLNVNLLGEAVLGQAEADRRLAGTRELLERPDVDYVSIKVSAVVSQLSMWAFDDAVERVVERLVPLYQYAAASPTPKFINLDMEEYRDLDLTIAVFTRLLERPELRGLEAGIVLQAYLPDSFAALQQLTAWAIDRSHSGGAPVKVRVVKGANLAMERVDAAVHGWPLATWASKQQTDANYKRMLAYALEPTRIHALRIGVAGHNLFDLAFARLLSVRRGVTAGVDFEMLLGMATGQAEAVRREVGSLLIYTPVVRPAEFDAAISYLVRRLEENASSENFMSAVFDLDRDETAFDREAERFRASLAAVQHTADLVPPPNREQDRGAESARAAEVVASPGATAAFAGFANEPDTDPALAANREWGRSILERAADSGLGAAAIENAAVRDERELARRIRAAREAGLAWGARPAAERAEALHAIAEQLIDRRAALIEVAASETGKTIAEGDTEVSEAIDFARWYAARALELDRVAGARFEPVALTAAVPPWNFPVAIPCGSVLAPLAAGSAVVLKPAPQARRTGAVLAEAIVTGLRAVGAPEELVTLVDLDEGELGRALVTAPEVDRVILTGSYDTAALFRSWRPDLGLLAETSGKNAIVVTPSADLDLAVNDLVRSAFGHAGQKCSAASLAILVGPVGRSERLLRQLEDAVRSLRVGWPADAATTMGPVIEPPGEKLLRGLTELGPGERWLVKPERLDASGRLWSPGVRLGVAPGSEFHLTEYFGPVLGVMRARDLDEALAWQNTVDYGLTAGLHSLDADEVAYWADRVEAGNLYVNRGVTGAIVGRQPFGGWKRSAVGPTAKVGGPNLLIALGNWRAADAEPAAVSPSPVPASGPALAAESDAPRAELRLDGLHERVRALIEAVQPALDYPEFEFIRRAAYLDERAWAEEFGVSRELAGLGVERNVLRYRRAPAVARLAEGGSLAGFVRVLVAAALAGSPLRVSSAVPLPSGIRPLTLGQLPLLDFTELVVETDAAFAGRLEGAARVRLVGPPDAGATLLRAIDGRPEVAVWGGEVTAAGRIELLPFVREQAVSLTAHRFGNPAPDLADLQL